MEAGQTMENVFGMDIAVHRFDVHAGLQATVLISSIYSAGSYSGIACYTPGHPHYLGFSIGSSLGFTGVLYYFS